MPIQYRDEIWDQYRNETDQTITIIGVLILSAKLCVERRIRINNNLMINISFNINFFSE